MTVSLPVLVYYPTFFVLIFIFPQCIFSIYLLIVYQLLFPNVESKRRRVDNLSFTIMQCSVLFLISTFSCLSCYWRTVSVPKPSGEVSGPLLPQKQWSQQSTFPVSQVGMQQPLSVSFYLAFPLSYLIAVRWVH